MSDTVTSTPLGAPDGAYAAGRYIHDADAHMVEPDGFYERYADPGIRDRIAELPNGSRGRRLDDAIAELLAAHHTDARERATGADVMLHKNLDALGSFIYLGPQPAIVGSPRLGVAYFELRFRNGYVPGIVATAKLDRWLSYGVYLGRFARGRWYQVPARAAAGLRELAVSLEPLRLTRVAVSK